MRRLRVLLALVMAALLLACRPPVQLAPISQIQATTLLQGQLILPEGYQTQASASQVRANATVTLIDPATYQAKGTGVTGGDGSFTVTALATFTPTIGGLYLLESNKALGGAGTPAFRLRTLVQFTATGWTSITGTAIRLSTATTAVAILWDHHGLAATDVLAKVSYEATTRTHRFADLTATLPERLLREVEFLVQEALLVNVDPIQAVRPDAGGRYGLSLRDRTGNVLANGGFEVATTTFPGWYLHGGAISTFSVETGAVYEGARALKLTVTAAGDTWYGQGWNGMNEGRGIALASGSTYTYSVFARGAAGGEKLALCLNYQAPFGEISSPAFSLTTAWKRYVWTFTSSYTTDRGFLMLRNGTGATQSTFPSTVYADAAQFEAGGAPTAYGPQGNLTIEGFANAFESANLTPAPGKVGRAVVVDHGLNLLANSGFDNDGNSDGIPDGMQAMGSGGTYSLDGEALFGRRSLKVVKASATSDYLRFPHEYGYRAGRTYTFSVWVKGENVSGTSNTDFGIYVDPYKAQGVYAAMDIRKAPAPTGTFGWTRLSYTHTFIENCASASVIPMFRNKTGTVWFDGFQVEENSYPSPYAGDGPDLLSFDAARFVNPHQGTIAFWYQPRFGWEDASAMGPLVAITNTGNDIVFNLAKDRYPDGRLRFFYAVRQETLTNHDWMGAEYFPTTAPWKAGEWHHVAMTWGLGGMTLYLDGAAVASNPYSGGIWTPWSDVHPSPNLGVLSFAGNHRNVATRINGSLDGLKVWDVQKGPEAIRREYLGL